MKEIKVKVSNETYDFLVKYSEQEYRTLENQILYMLSKHLNNVVLIKGEEK